MEPIEILQDVFGLSTFRPGQLEIIEDLLNGHHVLAMLPTGTGKSLCYQLPAVMRNGVTIVVSPLLSLMEDQVQQLKSNGFKRVVALNRFLSIDERKYVIDQLHTYRLIYISPEMLQSKFLLRKLMKCNVSFFVIDEAHCISQWGHEFRTDYLKLHEVHKKLGSPPCLAITATATPQIQEDIISQLKLVKYKAHIYSVDRPNIALVVERVSSYPAKVNRLCELVHILKSPGIIYGATRKAVEDLAGELRKSGVNDVAYYHGGMSNEDRILIQEQFIHGQIDIICCTNAFGMGVNKADIRFVVHFHFPLQVESYLQEIGRAGRDGNESIAILLYSDEDKAAQSIFLHHEFPTERDLDNVLQFLGSNKISVELDANDLLMQTGISEVMWRFIRYHLEMHEIFDLRNISSDDLKKVKMNILRKINERKHVKNNKYLEFLEWLTQVNSCRRARIVHYFNEKLKVKPNHCCDVCGVPIECYAKLSKIETKEHVTDWKTELKRLLHQ